MCTYKMSFFTQDVCGFNDIHTGYVFFNGIHSKNLIIKNNE